VEPFTKKGIESKKRERKKRGIIAILLPATIEFDMVSIFLPKNLQNKYFLFFKIQNSPFLAVFSSIALH